MPLSRTALLLHQPDAQPGPGSPAWPIVPPTISRSASASRTISSAIGKAMSKLTTRTGCRSMEHVGLLTGPGSVSFDPTRVRTIGGPCRGGDRPGREDHGKRGTRGVVWLPVAAPSSRHAAQAGNGRDAILGRWKLAADRSMLGNTGVGRRRLRPGRRCAACCARRRRARIDQRRLLAAADLGGRHQA